MATTGVALVCVWLVAGPLVARRGDGESFRASGQVGPSPGGVRAREVYRPTAVSQGFACSAMHNATPGRTQGLCWVTGAGVGRGGEAWERDTLFRSAGSRGPSGTRGAVGTGNVTLAPRSLTAAGDVMARSHLGNLFTQLTVAAP